MGAPSAVAASKSHRPRVVFSIDVECWGQSALDRALPIQDHAAGNLLRVLAMLNRHPDARATFFVLGKFARQHPAAVRDIHDAGHEVASHGFGHEEIFKLTPAAFRDDLRRTGDLLATIVGKPPRGYRAPVFSIVRESLWALQVLAEEGYTYDASIFPFAGRRYGIADWPRSSCRVQLDGGHNIIEHPLATWRALGRNVPISGGGYARLLPRPVFLRLMRAAARRQAIPPVFYCHPYEIDASEFTRVYPDLALYRRWHQGWGRRGFARKFLGLLDAVTPCAFLDLTREKDKMPWITLARGRRANRLRFDGPARDLPHRLLPSLGQVPTDQRGTRAVASEVPRAADEHQPATS